jgi:hypothetical protein
MSSRQLILKSQFFAGISADGNQRAPVSALLRTPRSERRARSHPGRPIPSHLTINIFKPTGKCNKQYREHVQTHHLDPTNAKPEQRAF